MLFRRNKLRERQLISPFGSVGPRPTLVLCLHVFLFRGEASQQHAPAVLNSMLHRVFRPVSFLVLLC